MRLPPKAAAASAAASFLLILILSLTWPVQGIWLLGAGLGAAVLANVFWIRDAAESPADPYAPGALPVTTVGAFGLTGTQAVRRRSSSSGWSPIVVLAPVSALALIMFVASLMGAEEQTATQTVELQSDVTAINRTGDGDPLSQAVAPPPSQAVVATTEAEASSGDNGEDASSSSTSQIRPIVVDAPRPANSDLALGEDEGVAPESLDAVEYIVTDGDTLYGIAERYGSTVDAIMQLNQLSAQNFIHPGDTLLIPRVASAEAESDDDGS